MIIFRPKLFLGLAFLYSLTHNIFMETLCTLPTDTADNLQKKLGHVFHDRDLLSQALTHSSWANEHHNEKKHNQRLEFLGDAVLELCISHALYLHYPDAREGPLTKLRASLVSEDHLAHLARTLDLPDAILLGRGEELQNGRHKNSLLADCFEAVVAAVYLDGGFSAARKVIEHVFAPYWPESLPESAGKDAKSRLQEICQKIYKDAPTYHIQASHGPEHAKQFQIQLTLPDGRIFSGTSTSCKKAEQAAAAACLRYMGINV